MPNISQSMIPYTITAGGIYTLTENLSLNSGNVITINTTSLVTIEGAGYSITFGVTGAGAAISKQYAAGSVVVNNTVMSQGPYTLLAGNYSYGIRLVGNANSLTVTNCTFNITKSESNNSYARAVYFGDMSGTRSISVTIQNCTINLSGNGNTCGIQIGGQTGSIITLTGEISNCTLNVTNNTIENRRGYGIQTSSDTLVDASGFSIHNNIFNGSSEVRSFNFCLPGGHATYSNTFNVSSSHCTCMRLGSHGTIYSNIFHLSSPNLTSGDIGGCISARYGVHNNEVYNNSCFATGNNLNCLACGGSEENMPPGVGSGPPHDNHFYNNYLEYHGNISRGVFIQGGSTNNSFSNNTYHNLDGAGYDVRCQSGKGGNTPVDTGYFTGITFTGEIGISRMLFQNYNNPTNGGSATVLIVPLPTITISGSPAPIIVTSPSAILVSVTNLLLRLDLVGNLVGGPAPGIPIPITLYAKIVQSPIGNLLSISSSITKELQLNGNLRW